MVLAPEILNQRRREANRLIHAGRLAEAEALMASLALSLSADPEFMALRGQVARGRNDLTLAIYCFREAARLDRGAAAHRFNLGESLAEAGMKVEAIAVLREALALQSQPSMGWLLLAQLLEQTGQPAEAINELERLAAAGSGDAQTLKAVALHAMRWGARELTERCARDVLDLAPGDFDATAVLHKLTADRVPSWHFAMMNDVARNEAYDRAIRRAVRPGMHVLDIGTGSGLLALMAARAGAAHVTTCEVVPAIAEVAAEIVARNGFADRITVMPKISTSLVLGSDMATPADLLVSEILSSDLLTENVVTAVEDARRRLLKQGARMIPRAISTIARLVGGQNMIEAVSVGTVRGFDLSPFNRFSPGAVPMWLSDQAFDTLSADLEALYHDLERDGAYKPEQRLEFTVTRAGTAAGVLQWIKIYLDDETVFENKPPDRSGASAWNLMLYPFPRLRRVNVGDTVCVRVGHSAGGLVFLPLEG